MKKEKSSMAVITRVAVHLVAITCRSPRRVAAVGFGLASALLIYLVQKLRLPQRVCGGPGLVVFVITAR